MPGVILAVMGSAIGLGNFLRFPGLAAKYEGGAFMIPYFVALLLLGIPIAWLEWTMGRAGGQKGFHSTPGIFRVIWPHRVSPYAGFLGLIVPTGIYMYYVVIEAWCLYYACLYATGAFPLYGGAAAYQSFFADFTGQSENGILFGLEHSNLIVFLLICYLLNMIIIYRGLARGIELVSMVGIPVLFISAIAVLIRVLTLGTPDPAMPERNVLNGLGFMWNPQSESKSFLEGLSNGEMWLAAAGQIFFSLSVGFGVIITYASYLKKEDDVVLSATTSVAGNTFAEVALGGMITIPAAFILLGPAAAGGGTFQLGFITLPMVFEQMPLGSIFGFLWFLLLFIAAITSSISMLQPAIAFFEEGTGTSRRASVSLLSFITFTGTTVVAYFSKDLIGLDQMDFWIGTVFIFLLATIQVILGGWVFGAERLIEEARKGSVLNIPGWVAFIIRFVSPVYLITVFVVWLYQNLGHYIETLSRDISARMTFLFILFLSGFFITLIAQAVRRWNKQAGEER
jgi:SNF family Na+-dependent transporter